MSTANLGSAVLGSMILGQAESTAPLFIVDRTQEHVDLLKRLHEKGWVNLSSEERNQWYGEAAKGAYNYTDLNRVEGWVSTLAGEFGLTLTTKTNWTVWDIPTQGDMSRYLGNIIAIRDACPWGIDFPTLPNSMNDLTYEMANNIETVLLMIYVRGASFPRSGECYSGEV